jgi:uncharacterized protein (DUF362 family)
MSLVSLVKIRKERFKEAIIHSLRLIDYYFPVNVRNVVIKPNMCYYWDYSTGHTTDPKFVASLIDVLREQISPKVNVSVVESDASAMKCKYAFRILGYEKMALQNGASLVNLSEEKSEKITTSVGKYSFGIKVPHTIKNADLRINVPKIKYMGKVKITCALKNVFGCNPRPRKFVYHPLLGEAIVAVNKAMKFDLCIVDGNIVSGVQARKLGLVMASRDPVATDCVAARIAKVNPSSMKCVQLASKEGIGKSDFIPRGIDWRFFGARYPRRGVQSKLTSKAFDVISMMHLGGRLGLD